MKLPKLAKYPKVSLCTPTFNRRPFYPSLIKCIEQQNYPKDKIEWIIIDDGTDKIEDMVSHLPYVKYYKYDTKMNLGKKRNLMHEKSKGDIIIYMDDDDYYPPERISHAVKTLQDNPKILIAGSSIIYIYFKHISQMYKFGPYGPTHSTAASFAFRRELLLQTGYDENASLAEEKKFLKDYSIPLVQLDPLKTILVFSHIQNTFDKKKLLIDAPNPVVQPSNVKIEDIMKGQEELYNFYVNDIDNILQNYDAGDVKNKPDVIKQISEINDARHKMMLKQREDQMLQHQANIAREKLFAQVMQQQALQRSSDIENKKSDIHEPVVEKKTIQVSKKQKQKQQETPVVVTADQIKLAEDAADKLLKELDLEEETKKKKNNKKKK
uniref:Glycosyltransferase 2-like domain-containing protein n=1 Tax=viral metagenome TaxID=1070528 RepID=A0A6C0E5A1_9ZZZZ